MASASALPDSTRVSPGCSRVLSCTDATLPLLRRAFSGFSGPERRQMGEKVKRLKSAGAGPGAETKPDVTGGHIDLERARRVLPVLAEILGVPYAG